MDQLAILLTRECEGMATGECALLGHWLAKKGLSDGLRVLGLMGRLSSDADKGGLDLLSWAARGGDESCLLLAGEVCSSGGFDAWGGGALHHWCEGKKTGGGAGAQILLAQGVDPTARDRWGLMPMHWSKDPVIWAWSMAALWGRGDADGWMECNGVGYAEVAQRLGNGEFPGWVAKARADRRQPGFGGKTSLAAVHVPLCWGKMDGRLEFLGESEADQDSLARILGL